MEFLVDSNTIILKRSCYMCIYINISSKFGNICDAFLNAVQEFFFICIEQCICQLIVTGVCARMNLTYLPFCFYLVLLRHEFMF